MLSDVSQNEVIVPVSMTSLQKEIYKSILSPSEVILIFDLLLISNQVKTLASWWPWLGLWEIRRLGHLRAVSKAIWSISSWSYGSECLLRRLDSHDFSNLRLDVYSIPISCQTTSSPKIWASESHMRGWLLPVQSWGCSGHYYQSSKPGDTVSCYSVRWVNLA